MEIVYFELNNWVPGKYYPEEEPFITWLGKISDSYFNNKEWVRENKLCVVRTLVDMSINYCVTATKEWVDKNCPTLVKYPEFLRYAEDDGKVYGQWGDEFLEYKEENFGIVDRK